MAVGDPISGTGGDVKLAGGASLGNVGKWSISQTANIKKYANSESKFKRAVAGSIESSGNLECNLEKGERPPLAIGQRLEVELHYDTDNYHKGFIVVNSVAEGVNMDDGQVDMLVIGFDVDGELTPTGLLTGGSAGA